MRHPEQFCMKKKLAVYTIFFLLFLPATLAALEFERLGAEVGLPNNVIYCIMQDHRGFLWFSGEGGIARYDGHQVKVYQHDPQNPNSPSHNNVNYMIEDANGIFWCTTWGGGLNRFDPITETFRFYRHDPINPNSLSENRIQMDYLDPQGNIWIGTFNGGLNRLDPKTDVITRYLNVPGDSTSLSHNRVWSMVEDRRGNFWVATDDGLCRMDRGTGKFRRYYSVAGNPATISHNQIRRLYIDRAGTLWLATANGLCQYLPDTDTFRRYVHDPADSTSISYTYLLPLLDDSHGNFWAGTNGGGLNRLDRRIGTFTRYNYDELDPHTIGNDDIRALCEDQSGVVWIGTRGGGISRLNLNAKKFSTIRPDAGYSQSHRMIYTIYEDSDGTAWFGSDLGIMHCRPDQPQLTHFLKNPANPYALTDDGFRAIRSDRAGNIWVGAYLNGIFRLDAAEKQRPPAEARFINYNHSPEQPGSLSNSRVFCTLEDSRGQLWFGSNDGLNLYLPDQNAFRRFYHNPQNPNSLGHNSVISLFEDRDGDLWIGAWGGGVTRRHINVNDTTFTTYKNDPENPASLSNNDVQAISQDAKGALWFATSSGLNRLASPQNPVFERFYMQDGLPGNDLCAFLFDDTGNLWISTTKGLSRLDPRTKIFRNYDRSDGLQANEFIPRSAYKGAGGRLYFGGINGVTTFFPQQITDNLHIPPIMITDFRKYTQSVPFSAAQAAGQEIEVSYKDSFLSFEFAALDFTQPAKNKYAFMMEGVDKEWIPSGSRRFAGYTHLDGGHYVFRVKGSNNDGLWNEQGAALKIRIIPPPWKTWWAYLLYVIATFAAIWGYVAFKTRTQAEKLAARDRELERERQFLIQLQRAHARTTEANARLNLLLKGTRELAAAREKLMVMMKTANTILSNIGALPSTRVWVGFKNLQSDGQERYEYFDFAVETANGEPIVYIHDIHPSQSRQRDEPLRADQTVLKLPEQTGSFVANGALIIPARLKETLLGFLEIMDIKTTAVGPENAEFMDTLANSLAITLENISFSTQLEEKVKDRTRELVEAERQATLGQMAGMVAHELNNALSGVNTAVQALQRHERLDLEKIWHCWEADEQGLELQTYLAHWVENEQELIAIAQLAHTANDRALTVVRDLQGLVGQRSRQSGHINLCEVSRETFRLMANLLAGIQVIEDFEDDAIEITATSGQIGQIFTNLLNNAVHALQNRPNPAITVAIRREPDGATIAFGDNGCGIAPEIRPHIFEPFFTTKAEAGRGLGLSIILRIIKDLGGTVDFSSAINEGTTFTVWLPSREDAQVR